MHGSQGPKVDGHGLAVLTTVCDGIVRLGL